MLEDYLYTFLLSLSPLGEGRVGIPYGISKGITPSVAFAVGLLGNLLVFPLFYRLISFGNKYFWRFHTYRSGAIFMARRAKKGAGKNVVKYGAWGLMVFVMIPLPVTGAYVATIAAYLMPISYRKSIVAVSTGVIIALSIITGGSKIYLLLTP